MSSVRQIHLITIVLVLIAGYLWSQKLANRTYQEQLQQIKTDTADQLAALQERVEAKNDPLELVNFGRKFLAAGNPEFAISPLEKATELNPRYRDGWYLLGYSYIQAANELTQTHQAEKRAEYLQQAITALEQAKMIDSEHQPTKELLRQLNQPRQ